MDSEPAVREGKRTIIPFWNIHHGSLLRYRLRKCLAFLESLEAEVWVSTIGNAEA
jgi:hypothetical protein